MKKLATIIFLFASIGIFAQNYETGFKDLAWDTALEDVQDQFTASNNKIPPFKGYDKVNDDLSFEGITAQTITYGFKKGKLGGVNVVIKNSELEQLVSVITERYGDPKKTDTPFLVNYEWHMEKFRFTITYLPTKPGDANVTMGISKRK
ncbi:MAG: hypothetical protein KAQ75_04170 [Bacteroidales bacterium]|nr:hypothetical protein [Bacteroidales bacterium]